MRMPQPCQHESGRERRRCRRCRKAFVVFAGAGAMSFSGGAVAYAMLAAVATGATTASSGTLRLSLDADGVGFSQPVANLAPGDVVNRFVTLSNDGTLAATDLTLKVTGTTSTLLTTDPTKGLAVSVASCSGAWTPTTGVCSGTTTSLLSGSAVSTLTSPDTLIDGDVPVGATRHLKVSLSLPDQVETTVNGVPPVNTIQGLTTTLNYTFTMSQRTARTSNS